MTVAVTDAADALGATTVDIKPNPIADTATSAMRLRSVFVDICFLSVSRSSDDPNLGLERFLVPLDSSYVLMKRIPHSVSGRSEESYLVICHRHRLREYLCL